MSDDLLFNEAVKLVPGDLILVYNTFDNEYFPSLKNENSYVVEVCDNNSRVVGTEQRIWLGVTSDLINNDQKNRTGDDGPKVISCGDGVYLKFVKKLEPVTIEQLKELVI